MKDISPIYNFTAEPDGEFTKVVYKKTPISYKMAGPLCWYMFIPAFCLTMLAAPSSLISGAFIFVVILIGLSLIVVSIINFFRKTGEIRINEKSVVAADKTYQLDHVSSFLVKDPSGMYTNETTVIINNYQRPSLAGTVNQVSQGMGQMANESRRAIQKHIRDAGYKIVIRYGSKDIPIAKGLGETEVDVLFQKVTELAGFNTSK